MLGFGQVWAGGYGAQFDRRRLDRFQRLCLYRSRLGEHVRAHRCRRDALLGRVPCHRCLDECGAHPDTGAADHGVSGRDCDGVLARCARTTDGKLYCWGSSNHGESATDAFVPEPALVQGLPRDVRRVFTGYYHTCVLDASGGLYCWGKNQFGELGTGDTESSKTPRLTTIGSVEQVVMGEDHSCALKSDRLGMVLG